MGLLYLYNSYLNWHVSKTIDLKIRGRK